MARREIGKEDIRNIQKSSGSYLVSIPIGIIRNLRWQERQKVTVRQKGKQIIIEDWEPGK